MKQIVLRKQFNFTLVLKFKLNNIIYVYAYKCNIPKMKIYKRHVKLERSYMFSQQEISQLANGT
jgi:hypothetical protein